MIGRECLAGYSSIHRFASPWFSHGRRPSASPKIIRRQRHLHRAVHAGRLDRSAGADGGAAREQRLGKSFVVENRPGAGQQIGVNAVAKAAPDDTLLTAPAGDGDQSDAHKKIATTPVKISPIATWRICRSSWWSTTTRR
jgi:hypothetical protein